MGNGNAKHLGPHSPLPADQTPYPGPPYEYSIVNVNVQLKTHLAFSNNGGITTDVDTYYPILAQRYQDGFKLLSFIKIISQASRSGFFNSTLAVPFQGIFSRYAGNQQNPGYQLKVEKSIVHLNLLRSGLLFGFGANSQMDANIAHIYQLIYDHCSRGGRFICMEMTGQQTSQGFRAAMHGVSPGYGIDLFFDIPTQPSALYSYTAVAVAIQINYRYGSINVTCDWMGNLAAYLNQGWKLADIFLAYDQMAFYQRRVPVKSINSIWFFEKEVNKLSDPTPLYEGTTVDVYIKIKTAFGGITSDMNLEPMLQEMGNRGWEFVCLVETPSIISSGFSTVTQAAIAFFQRPLRQAVPNYNHPSIMEVTAAQQATAAALPPSYSDVMDREKKK